MQFDKIQYIQLNKGARAKIIQKLADFFKNQDRIKLILVYGSFLRRNFIRDIDVAIYAAPPLSFGELLREGTDLEISIGKPIDLVQLPDLSPHFRLKILREGQLIFPTKNRLYHELLAAAISQLQDLRIETQMSLDTSNRVS